ncbi:hypothetical protein, partial [Klebsiella michiganensis]|uniref:hypothetical protein n=1 Tax=Klebsiella michiganensis TaxID=1134687 RepID=UPI00254E8DC4
KRAYCLKTQPATGETYPKSDLFNKALLSVKLENLLAAVTHIISPYKDVPIDRVKISASVLFSNH